jgi:hypothetical protein
MLQDINRVTRRKLMAWLLLSVFIPMVMLTSVHRHSAASRHNDVCELCVAHVHHAGHLQQHSAGTTECLLCQLGALPFVVPSNIIFSAFISILFVGIFAPCSRLAKLRANAQSTRAPPYSVSFFNTKK